MFLSVAQTVLVSGNKKRTFNYGIVDSITDWHIYAFDILQTIQVISDYAHA